ncbi:MAG: insulinase family protein [Spirochaetes bacterium]|nr:insulinase family protein [Spirochaetota bacterium]
MRRMMKLRFFCPLICAAWIALPGITAASGADALPVDLPPVRTLQTSCGAKVFFVGDELPQLTIVASVGYGRLHENSESAGLCDLLARTISLGGSKRYPGMKLHERVDSIGGMLSVSSSFERTVISLSVLPRFREEAFSIVSSLLTEPNLDEEYLLMARSLVADEIRRRYDNPSNIAFDRTMGIIFEGKGYGAIPTVEKMNSFTLKMVRDAWTKYFGARNMLIGVSSSIPYEQIRKDCERHFSSLAPGEKMDYSVDAASVAATVRRNSRKIFLFPKDIPQATIVVGTLAPDIRDDRCYPLALMNFVLGEGSFNSRLMREIRVKRGMAYAVSSVIRFRRNTGVFLAYAQTKIENVAMVLPLLKGNITGMGRDRLPRQDIGWAKRSISNSYIFRFETPMDILGNYLEREYCGLPEDYYERYLSRINDVTDGDVMRESERLFRGGLVTCVVGREDLRETLKDQGEVVLLK